MSPERALAIWRSIRSTFILFLIVVPVVVATNGFGTPDVDRSRNDLILSALGLVLLAAVIAEVLRRIVNAYAGSAVCRWWGAP